MCAFGPHSASEKTDVHERRAGLLDEAKAVRDALMVEVGEKVRARGDRIVDVVDD